MEVPPGPAQYRAVKRNLLGSISIALTLAAGFSKDSHANAYRVKVRVFDYVGLGTATRAELETNAARILVNAGLVIDFAECYSGGVETESEDCTSPLGPTDLVLRVFRPKAALEGEELGYAAMTPEGGAYITVFIDPGQEKARVSGLSNGILFGHAVAHEIGHLLLGANSHSLAGIMRPRWRPADEEWMVKGALLFSAGQARRMRASLTARVQ
jgi:hypothetical protein